jgi:hypothetical protein
VGFGGRVSINGMALSIVGWQVTRLSGIRVYV